MQCLHVHRDEATYPCKELWRTCDDPVYHAISDRIACSIANAQIPHMYSYVHSGVILRPSSASVLCAWSHNGATDGRLCDPPGVSDSCVPGCGPHKPGDPTHWCEHPTLR